MKYPFRFLVFFFAALTAEAATPPVPVASPTPLASPIIAPSPKSSSTLIPKPVPTKPRSPQQQWDIRRAPKVEVSLKMVDARGDIKNIGMKTISRWLFLNESKKSPVGQPVIEVDVEISSEPPKLKSTNALDLRVIPGTPSHLIISTDLEVTTLIFDDDDGNELSLILTAHPEYPWVYIDPSCERDGLSIEEKLPSKGIHLYTGIYCVESSYTESDVYIFNNPEATFQAPQSLTFDPNLASMHVIHIDTQKVSPETSVAFEYQVHQTDPNKKIQYRVRYRPSGKFRKFSYWVGASLTLNQFSYQVDFAAEPYDISLSQIDLTFRGALSYKYGPNAKWDFNLSGYVAALHLATTFSGDSFYRSNGTRATLTSGNVNYFGVNLRARYALPIEHVGWKYFVSGGFYGLMTRTTDPSFGLSNIGGPQIFPTAVRLFRNHASLGFYFKFSPVANQLSLLNLDSREIALGSSYLFPSKTNRQIGVSIDYANLAYKGTLVVGNTSSPVRASNSSISAGAMFSF